MSHTRYVQIGRVALVAAGKDEGKLCTIVDVIDAHRALIDGPKSGVRRKAANFKHLHLTKFTLPLRPSARTRTVKKAWDTAKVGDEWDKTVWAKKLKARKLRAQLTDFDRFKLMKAKQARNRLVRSEFKKLWKVASKEKKPAKKKPVKPKGKGKPPAKK